MGKVTRVFRGFKMKATFQTANVKWWNSEDDYDFQLKELDYDVAFNFGDARKGYCMTVYTNRRNLNAMSEEVRPSQFFVNVLVGGGEENYIMDDIGSLNAFLSEYQYLIELIRTEVERRK